MRVHVTGGSGFLGTHVLPLLRARGHDVTALTRSEAARRRVEAAGATALEGDLDDAASVDKAFTASGADALVNLASLGFGHAPTVVAAAEEAGIRRAVFVSTTAVFTQLDARSKSVRLAAEDLIRASALDWTIVRPTMIYGTPADRNMARLLRFLQRTPVVLLPGGGGRLQQPVHVDDVASAVVAALEAPVAVHRAYDIAGPEPLSLARLFEEVAEAIGRRPRHVSVPLRPVVAAVRTLEAVVPRLPLRAEQLERLAEDKAFDIGPARRDLAYRPRTFGEGIRQEALLLSA